MKQSRTHFNWAPLNLTQCVRKSERRTCLVLGFTSSQAMFSYSKLVGLLCFSHISTQSSLNNGKSLHVERIPFMFIFTSQRYWICYIPYWNVKIQQLMVLIRSGLDFYLNVAICNKLQPSTSHGMQEKNQQYWVYLHTRHSNSNCTNIHMGQRLKVNNVYFLLLHSSDVT